MKTAPGISFWEHFRKAPGCGEGTPWTGRWKSGDPGVSGNITVMDAEDGEARVSFEIVISGSNWPCGNTGTHTAANAFFVGLPQ